MSPGLLFSAQVGLLTPHNTQWNSSGSSRRGPGCSSPERVPIKSPGGCHLVTVHRKYSESRSHCSLPTCPMVIFPQISMAGRGSSMTQIISLAQRGIFSASNQHFLLHSYTSPPRCLLRCVTPGTAALQGFLEESFSPLETGACSAETRGAQQTVSQHYLFLMP